MILALIATIVVFIVVYGWTRLMLYIEDKYDLGVVVFLFPLVFTLVFVMIKIYRNELK